jgi:hypothetical protein
MCGWRRATQPSLPRSECHDPITAMAAARNPCMRVGCSADRVRRNACKHPHAGMGTVEPCPT